MQASTKVVLIAAGLGITAYVLYRSVPKVGEAVASAGNAVNPLNPSNVFATATNKVGAVLSGDSDFSLGSWLYDLTHPDAGAAATTSSSPLQSRPIDWGTGTGWDVTNGAASTAPLGQISDGW